MVATTARSVAFPLFLGRPQRRVSTAVSVRCAPGVRRGLRAANLGRVGASRAPWRMLFQRGVRDQGPVVRDEAGVQRTGHDLDRHREGGWGRQQSRASPRTQCFHANDAWLSRLSRLVTHPPDGTGLGTDERSGAPPSDTRGRQAHPFRPNPERFDLEALTGGQDQNKITWPRRSRSKHRTSHTRYVPSSGALP